MLTKLKIAKYFILFILAFPHISFPQTISAFEVSGNRMFNSSEIKTWSGINIGMKYYINILDSAKIKIAFNLAQRGYLNANFNNSEIAFSPDSEKIEIKLSIDEGSPTLIRDVIFINPDSLDLNNIVNSFFFLEENILNRFEVEATINEALTYYENNGYPFAKIILSSVEFINDSSEDSYFADIYIKLEKGEKNTIDKVEIAGNETTEDYVITRELRIDSGEVYSQQRIEELPSRLNKLRFFEPMNVPQFYVNSQNEGVLLVEVKEKQTNNFDGIVGYIPPRNANESGYLTGLVNVSLRNLFGTGRAAAIRWQQFDRFSQELELKYLEPWLFGYPFNISGNVFQRKQDSSYVQRRFEGSLEYLATQEISAAVLISTENVIPTENFTNRFTVFNSTSLTTGLNITLDTRDDPYSPTEGLLFINYYSFSRKKIFGPAQFITPQTETRINLQRLALSFSLFYQLFSRQIIALGVNGRELRGSFFEESDLFRLGGTTSLRGYREDQFLGNRILWTNLEYRFLLTRRTFAFAFFDTGYFLRSSDADRNILKQEDFKIGYGVGLNLETGIGVLGVSFALARGDAFSDGKIHFGIINEF